MSSAKSNEGPESEPIAIIGMACRLPGADNLRELWELLIQGGDAVGTYPGNRFPRVDAELAAARERQETATMALGGFLEDIDGFDARAFEMSPREATYLDPQHRLLLEVAWAALEDAGQRRQDPKAKNTGVFAGLWASDFENVLYGSGADLEFYAMTGSGSYGASGRISYTFGFEGPSLTVDAACSSSLVAVHLACQSLRAGECAMALAGGANAILATESTKMFTGAGMLARDGRCKFGSAEADGFVRSEGAGMVVLKPLSDALAAGDPVRAVIRGSAVSNDGRTSGTLMTPSREGQRETLHRAWAAAGVSGKEIRYFEAHGTGTSVGDPVEVGAIADALRDDGAEARRWIGSIKTNIGHTESAAGVAGLIKTVLALEQKTVPPSRLTGGLNPKIDWEASPLRLLTEPLDLRGEASPVLAGISSFGLTGTNAHLIVQEYRETRTWPGTDRGAREYLLPVSARSAGALATLLRSYEEFSEDGASLREICGTASLRRRHDGYRAAVVCGSMAELRESAAEVEQGGLHDAVAKERRRRVVFIAPGQGSQWAGMARELLVEEPVFRDALAACDAAIRRETGWSVVEGLTGPDTEAMLGEIDFVQPALFAMSVALAALWRSWGVVPDAVIGHSMGEVAAAHLAGALSLTDAAAVICRRSRLMKSIRGAGAMLTVELSLRATEAMLQAVGGDIAVGASNSPETTIVSGAAEAIGRLETMLAEREIFCRRIKVDVASHSSQVDTILDALRSDLDGIVPKRCEMPLFSTVTGGYLQGTEMDAEYWAANLRQPVGFAEGIEALARDGYDVFVELSPHPVLLPGTEATLRKAGLTLGKDAVAVASTRRGKGERRELLGSLGALYRFGAEVAWEALYPEPVRCVALPEYPFQRERCWPELKELQGGALRDAGRCVHPLLGRRFEQPGAVVWEIAIDLDRLPYLRDHRVHGTIVLPAAAQVELVLAAMRQEEPEAALSLDGMRFEAAMQVAEDGAGEFQLAVRRAGEGFAFEITGRSGAGEAWVRHASGSVVRRRRGKEPIIPLDLERLKGAVRVEKQRHYRLRARAGIGYGPAFRLIEEAWCGGEQCLARIARLGKEEGDAGRSGLHPAVLDNCFQALQLARSDGEGFLLDDTSLPVAVGRFEVVREMPVSRDIFCRAQITTADAERGLLRGDLTIADERGAVLSVVKGFEVKRVSGRMEERAGELLLEIAWQPFELPAAIEVAGTEAAGTGAAKGRLAVVFCDAGGCGDALATRMVRAGWRVVLVRQGSELGCGSDGSGAREYLMDAGRREDFVRLFEDLAADGEVPSDMVHLWRLGPGEPGEFDGRQVDSLLEQHAAGTYAMPWLVQAIGGCNWSEPPRLWMVTRGAVVAVEGDSRLELAGATLWGMGAAVAVEHPELRASLVDLGVDGANDAELLCRLIGAGPDEDRIALRDAAMYVARFRPAAAELKPAAARMLRADEEYAFEVPAPGILDNVILQAGDRLRPGVGEVAVEVVAAGLNFIDVTKAMGIYPTDDPAAPLRVGAECAGRVVEVGAGVTRFQAGDEVMAFSNAPARKGLLASRVCLPEATVLRKPASLNFAQAAALPIAYVTAHYALTELARVQAGEWVLIPAGAGGVGLAAIAIAHHAGAHVIATASSPEKREYLRSLGVAHVVASRTLAFADEVMRITGGRGVDIVLNSLTGEYIAKSLAVLRPFGRFLELGKRDIYEDRQVGLRVFRNNLSYHAVDLAAAMEFRTEYFAVMLRLVTEAIEAGELGPLPVTEFRASEGALPFHFMAQGRHTGKIVVTMGREVHVLPAAKTALFRKDRTYLISGGMGGVGSTVAEWMASNGAGCLVLLSRREESEATQAVLRRIAGLGAKAVHARTDIVDRAALDGLLATVRREMPPIAGVMQAATVIDDASIAELSPERFAAVMGPKVTGTWNLFEATAMDGIEWMVLFSSIASVYPQPGQGSYAAANAFLDSFARWATAGGRTVVSINWNGWEQIGLARETGTGRSIAGYAQQGFGTMAGPRALTALRRAMETGVVQAVASPFDAEQAAEFFGAGRIPPILRGVLAGVAARMRESGEQTVVQARLRAAGSLAVCVEVLQEYLIEELGRVLKLAPERIGRETLFGSIGLDSLMTLELVRRLKTGLGVAVPTTAVFNYPTAQLLAAEIARRMHLHPVATAALADEAGNNVHDRRNGTESVKAVAAALLDDGITDEEALQALLQPQVFLQPIGN